MTQDHPSKLSFSIEEAVWLNKGQEIAEIVSMSLEPDIHIEETSDYVLIKGGLRLSGEYYPSNSNAENPKVDEAFRTIEEVKMREDTIGEITHFFPIDVTIPLSRIQNIDDVYVQVESFDYDIPEKSCIQLTADVAISGMSGYEQETNFQTSPRDTEEIVEVSNENKVLPNIPAFQPLQTFSFEAKKAETKEGRGEMQAPPRLDIQETTETKGEQQVSPLNEVNEEVPAAREEPSKSVEEVVSEPPKLEVEMEQKETTPPKEPRADEGEAISAEPSKPMEVEAGERKVTVEAGTEVATDPIEENPAANFVPNHPRSAAESTKETTEEIVVNVEEREEEETLETKINLAPLKKISEAPPIEQEEIAIEVGREEEEPQESTKEIAKVEKTRKDENALYLTKMLENGEEQFSKVRMCIVQENESLDTICERYDLSLTQILRVNRLNEERVEEGQIIYIPIKNVN